MISAVVGYDRNKVIGRDNDLPWRLSSDLKRFREITQGHKVIMGRKTFDSIVSRRGGPLPDRESIVISRSLPPGEGYIVADSVDEALRLIEPPEEGFIIGGEQIFRATLDLLDRIYLTLVEAEIQGDTFFPDFDETQWNITQSQTFPADEKNEYPYTFITMERK